MIISPCLPEINGFFGKLRCRPNVLQHVKRMVVGILTHRGRMSAQQAASAIVGEARHRGTIGRFLERHVNDLSRLCFHCAQQVLHLSQPRGCYAFIIDTTNVGHQGRHTPNTFSTGNRCRRPAKGRRYSKYRRALRSCHAFVWGLLITPDGRRIPSFLTYYTREYCAQRQRPHSTQADLAAKLVRDLLVPAGAEVVVLGDTAYESWQLRAACAERGFTWIMPANPERVLDGAKPRPKLWSLTKSLRSEMFAPVRLPLNRGSLVAMRRLSATRAEKQSSNVLRSPGKPFRALDRRDADRLFDKSQTTIRQTTGPRRNEGSAVQ